MRAITTIFLSNTLSAILEKIEETPDVDQQYPALLEFKRTLIQRMRTEDQIRDVAQGNS